MYAQLDDDPDLPHWDLGELNYALAAPSWSVYVAALQPTDDEVPMTYWPMPAYVERVIDVDSVEPVSADDVSLAVADPWRGVKGRLVTQDDVERLVDAVSGLPESSRRLQFSGCVFAGDIDFAGLSGALGVVGRFLGDCTIGRGVDRFVLDRVVFEQSLHLTEIHAVAQVRLSPIRVKGELSVVHSSFNDFIAIDSRFDGPVRFSDTTFRSEAGFRDVTFGSDAQFVDCVFERRSVFVRARFNGRADFTGSRAAETIKWRAAAFASPPSGAEHMHQ